MTTIGPDHYRFADEIGPDGVKIYCQRFVVVGETPRCYYVLRDGCAHYAKQDSDFSRAFVKQHRKRVLKTSWKRYCYPELKDAMRSYVSRKSWQIQHAALATARATAALGEATRLVDFEGLAVESFPHQCEGGEYIKGMNWGEY